MHFRPNADPSSCSSRCVNVKAPHRCIAFLMALSMASRSKVPFFSYISKCKLYESFYFPLDLPEDRPCRCPQSASSNLRSQIFSLSSIHFLHHSKNRSWLPICSSTSLISAVELRFLENVLLLTFRVNVVWGPWPGCPGLLQTHPYLAAFSQESVDCAPSKVSDLSEILQQLFNLSI